MIYRIVPLILFLSLCACGIPRSPAGYDLSKSEASLAEASYSVSRSIVDVAEREEAAHPLPELAPPPNPVTYGMGGITSVDWSGPVEPLVRQVAKAANYRVVVLGTAPSIPVLVTVYRKRAMLGDVLRDIGYQSGVRAKVIVFPETRVIELRYAKN